jgi:acylphosphatase
VDEKGPGVPRAVSVRVFGRVQGVSFRWACEREASRLGLAGWVRNEPDGSVATYAEGPGDAVDALLAWCGEGPPAARVERVEVDEVPAEGATGFRTVG